MGGNLLQGEIPSSFGQLQKLQHLDVSDDNLNGPIPNEVFHLVSLSVLLNLSHNSLSGELPADVGKLTSINVLDVSGNTLSGKIPLIRNTSNYCIDTPQSSSLGIQGIISYAPPEYRMGSAASKEGDVYSYGILVLEMFSGRRPTDKLFEDHLNLHNLVKDALPNGVAKVMESTLHLGGVEETPVAIVEVDLEIEESASSNRRNANRMGSKEKGCLVSLLGIGVGCSAESPQERMKMRDVAKELHFIRSNFLGVRIYE
ncbi:Leucine-rich receptor-like protein kinase family protein [Euphorbia peplus]|nr:Leucine-rich receptor-like protein kinase family protein [Euphorbia peplus]